MKNNGIRFIRHVMVAGITLLAVFAKGDMVSADAGTKTYTDAQLEFFESVYDHMTQRDEEFDVSYKNSDMDWSIEDIYYVLAQIDAKNTCDDYDYLRGNINEIECVSKHSVISGTKVTFTFSWLEDREQTDRVDAKVKEILKVNKVDDMSDYKKIKFVHDYVVKNIRYDDSKTHFSAYDGLFNKTTVCQGYALLTYRMLTQAGVRCRYIVGKYTPKGSSDGENHAWNLVKLGNVWYYMDNTWDSCNYSEVGTEESMNMYFLKGARSFEGEHQADEIENGDDFNNLYVISQVDYNPTLNNGGNITEIKEDDAVTPHEFFRKSDDGTGSSSSKVIDFFDRIYYFVTKWAVELIAAAVIIIILGVVGNKLKKR